MSLLAKLFLAVALVSAAKCVPDCEHTSVVVIDCDDYLLIGPAVYQPSLLQWCPASI